MTVTAASQPGPAAQFTDVVRSEFVKLRSVRSTWRALAAAVVFNVAVAALLPQSWQDTIGPYLPMNAGDTIYSVRHEAHMLGAWPGFGVFCLYAAAAIAAGFILITRRDA